MKLRIPYWPNRALTLGGRPNPMAVRVEVINSGHPRPIETHRLASAPGWTVLLVRYDRKANR